MSNIEEKKKPVRVKMIGNNKIVQFNLHYLYSQT